MLKCVMNGSSSAGRIGRHNGIQNLVIFDHCSLNADAVSTHTFVDDVGCWIGENRSSSHQLVCT